MPKITQIVVDTNVLLDLAHEADVVIDCLETIAKRIPQSRVIVLPTVILELNKMTKSGTAAEMTMAATVLRGIIQPWGFTPVNSVPACHGIVRQIGGKLRARGIIPEEEIHDSFIVAEAALCGAAILISNDSHIKDIDREMLKIELDASDVSCPLIASPWTIVNNFFR